MTQTLQCIIGYFRASQCVRYGVRSAFILPFSIGLSVHGQMAMTPERWSAPLIAEVDSAVRSATFVYGDTVTSGDRRLKREHRQLTGVVVSLRMDSTLHIVQQYQDGRRSGKWYTLDIIGQVSELVDYDPDGFHRTYRYGASGALKEYCQMYGCKDDVFDRIFGGWCPGTCTAYDTLRRVTSTRTVHPDGSQIETSYYPDGQMAHRRDLGSIATNYIEQWCPSGKRVGQWRILRDSKGLEPQIRGTAVMWSGSEGCYYLVKSYGRGSKLRSIPEGKWSICTAKQSKEVWSKLKLDEVDIHDAEQPRALPCDLPDR